VEVIQRREEAEEEEAEEEEAAEEEAAEEEAAEEEAEEHEAEEEEAENVYGSTISKHRDAIGPDQSRSAVRVGCGRCPPRPDAPPASAPAPARRSPKPPPLSMARRGRRRTLGQTN